MTRALLISNLCFMHGVIRVTEPLLKKAVAKAKGRLWTYYEQHLQEETGHVELLEADLIRLGVTEIPRYHAAAQLAGSQFHLLETEHPALFLGYMHMLESRAPKIEDVMRMEREFEVELTCLQHHAVHDPGHVAEIEKQISYQLAEIQKLIAWNEQNCAMLLEGVFKDMCQ